MAGTAADEKLYPGLKQAYKCDRVKLIMNSNLISPLLLHPNFELVSNTATSFFCRLGFYDYFEEKM
jgi:hypothetical protein